MRLVWTLTANGVRWECRLISQPRDVWLVQVLREGRLASWYVAFAEAQALAWAEAMLDALNTEH